MVKAMLLGPVLSLVSHMLSSPPPSQPGPFNMLEANCLQQEMDTDHSWYPVRPNKHSDTQRVWEVVRVDRLQQGPVPCLNLDGSTVHGASLCLPLTFTA